MQLLLQQSLLPYTRIPSPMHQPRRSAVRVSLVLLFGCLAQQAQAFLPPGGVRLLRQHMFAAAPAASTPLATEDSAGDADADDGGGDPSSPGAVHRRATWVPPFLPNAPGGAPSTATGSGRHVQVDSWIGQAPAFAKRTAHYDMSASAALAPSEKTAAAAATPGEEDGTSGSSAEKELAPAAASSSERAPSTPIWRQPSHPPAPVDAAAAKSASDRVDSWPGTAPTFLSRRMHYDMSASAAPAVVAAEPPSSSSSSSAAKVVLDSPSGSASDPAASTATASAPPPPKAAAASSAEAPAKDADRTAPPPPPSETVLQSSSSDATATASTSSPKAADSSSEAPVAAEEEATPPPPPPPLAAKAASSPPPPVEFEPEPSVLTDSPVYRDVALTIKRAKETLAPFRKKIQDNVAEGNVGERGEEWAVAQLAILLFVVMGSVPLIGGLINLLAGPGLVAGGIGVCAAGLKGLGKSLSPWPAPIEDNELNTEGIYGMMRHPMYTGLVMVCLGFGVVTDSPLRMLLAVVLALVLDKKADKEEKMLIGLHGTAYEDYRKTVAKFVPRFY